MNGAHVLGVGMTAFERRSEGTVEDLAAAATLDALVASGVALADVAAVHCGNVYGGMLPAQRIAARVGLTGRPGYNLEAACSSSAVAFHLAVHAVRSGLYDTVLVLGVEKLSAFGGGTLPLNPDDLDVAQGVIMPAVYAMRAQRYLDATGATVEDLAEVAVKNRGNGAQTREPSSGRRRRPVRSSRPAPWPTR